jgi:nitroreductase
VEFYDVINSRRTVREFEPEAVPEEVLGRILSAAFRAPTNDHMRDWHYIVVQDRATAARLLNIIPRGISDADMEQLIRDWNLNDELQQACYRSAVPKQYRMLSEAAAILVPLFAQKTDILHPENLSHLNGFASIWCSIGHVLLAAAAEGYGCCLRVPLGDEGAHARAVLGFPADYLMPCLIGIGKPKAGLAPVPQKEIDLNTRIHRDKF